MRAEKERGYRCGYPGRRPGWVGTLNSEWGKLIQEEHHVYKFTDNCTGKNMTLDRLRNENSKRQKCPGDLACHWECLCLLMHLRFLWFMKLLSSRSLLALGPRLHTFCAAPQWSKSVSCMVGTGCWPKPLVSLQILWTFSIYLESVAILPQLFMISKTGEAETITTHYLFFLGLYRALYLVNWIWRFYFEGFFDLIAVVAGVVQTILYCDFFYLYITKGTSAGSCLLYSLP